MNHLRLNSVKLYLPVGGGSLRDLFTRRQSFDDNSRIVDDHGGRFCKALDGITLEINAGEQVGLIGVNGAGKSSLLRVLAGIYQPTDGTIDISGRVSTLFAPNIGMNDNASGAENIYISARTLGMSRAEIAAAKDDIIRFADIGEFIHMPMRTYSAGMKMRLGFAIATAVKPEILLIDEVFGAGDAAFRTRAKERMKELTKRAGVLVMATHSDGVLRDLCNRILWLEDGRLKFDGGVDEALALFKEETVRLQKNAAARKTPNAPAPSAAGAGAGRV